MTHVYSRVRFRVASANLHNASYRKAICVALCSLTTITSPTRNANETHSRILLGYNYIVYH